MSFEFKPLVADSINEILSYSSLRDIITSEGQFMNQFIWADYYNTMYSVNDKFLFYKMRINNEFATMLPLCKEEDILSSFFAIKDYFNNELCIPLKMYIVDRATLKKLKTSTRFNEEFRYEEDRDCFDYIYDANKLRTLSGKLYHKKKNHLNSFIKKYSGRFEYRTLCCSDTDTIASFHQNWLDSRKVAERVECIKSEENGILRLFQNCSLLNCKIGGVFIDDKLEAYSIGSYNEHLKYAFIHVEKANVSINGLYNYINQQFLINEFPDVEFVNREDDLGQEGLRKSKLSYNPIFMGKKYNVFQR